MVVYRQRLASMLYNSVILQALLIWTMSLLVGGYPAAVSLGLSFLSVVLMWTFSLCMSVPIAFLLSLICSSPVPYIAHPWLVIGLFGAPAVLGALIGQHVGFLILQKYLWHGASKREPRRPPAIQDNLIKWEAERWLFKGGFIQWLIVLIVGNFFKVGSSYLALVWLVSPAFACKFKLSGINIVFSDTIQKKKKNYRVFGCTPCCNCKQFSYFCRMDDCLFLCL